MIIKPIIPIWAMTIICVLFLVMKRRGILNYIRQIIIVLLLFAINLRPYIPGNVGQPAGSLNVDVLFVVDNTISMLAEDYNGNGRRLDAVKEDCRYIIEQLPGASFSVVTFDNTVQVATPYTIDTNVTMQVIDILKGQTKLYASGTSINDAMAAMEDILDNDRDTYQVVFFISDGENTSGRDLGDYSGLEDYVDAGAVLGYGTEEGGPMKVQYYVGDEMEPEYLYYYDNNYNEKQAISKIDEDNLKSIASYFGIEYVHMTKQSQIDNVLGDIKKYTGTLDADIDTAVIGGDREYYYYFIIPLVILLVFDFIYYRRRIFRKG